MIDPENPLKLPKAVDDSRAALDEHLAARALAAEAPAVGSRPVRDCTYDTSDILAITDGLQAPVILQKAGEGPTTRDG